MNKYECKTYESIKSFLNEYDDFNEMPIETVYRDYILFCNKLNIHSETKFSFNRYILQNTNHETVPVKWNKNKNGTRILIYKKICV